MLAHNYRNKYYGSAIEVHILRKQKEVWGGYGVQGSIIQTNIQHV